MNYKEVASQILEKSGGAENVNAVTYCTTRLRFRVTDETKLNKAGIKAIKGVVGVAESNGQQQVIIGADVENVYKEFIKLGSFAGAADNSKPAVKEKLTPQKAVGKCLEFIAGCVSPALSVIIAAGLVQVVISVLTTFCGIDANGNTITVLNAIGNAGFYFLPVLVGFSGAKRLGCNSYMGAFLGSILVYPTLAEAVSAGGMTFANIPIYAASYGSTVFPMVLGVFALKLGEWIGNKICPKFIKTIGKPLISILVAAPITLCVLGPIGAIFGNGLGAFVQWISNEPAWLVLGILGGITPFIVITGMNVGLIPIAINNVSMLGYDIVLTVSALGANLAAGGAAMGVAFKTKNKELKELGLTTGVTAIFGITEPALYGVNVPTKKPLIAHAIGGAVAGVYAGIVGLKCYGIASPGLCALPLYFAGGTASILNFFITGLIGFGVAFIAVQILGFDDSADEQEKEVSERASTLEEKSELQPEKIMMPIKGKVIPLNKVNDPAFSSGDMGPGIGVDAKEPIVRAPFDGMVAMLFPTGHACGLKSQNGAEILIHIGIDTVNLEGKHFTPLVKDGDKIRKGDPLIRFDKEAIRKEGYDTTIMCILTNADEYQDVQVNTNQTGDEMITFLSVR